MRLCASGSFFMASPSSLCHVLSGAALSCVRTLNRMTAPHRGCSFVSAWRVRIALCPWLSCFTTTYGRVCSASFWLLDSPGEPAGWSPPMFSPCSTLGQPSMFGPAPVGHQWAAEVDALMGCLCSFSWCRSSPVLPASIVTGWRDSPGQTNVFRGCKRGVSSLSKSVGHRMGPRKLLQDSYDAGWVCRVGGVLRPTKEFRKHHDEKCC